MQVRRPLPGRPRRASPSLAPPRPCALGIYLPEILNELDTRGSLPNLKGAAIGDGW